MEEQILISYLNDFIFCPVSIYFHKLYGSMDTMLYQETSQINGKNAHATIDNNKYSTSKNILQGIDIYCQKYNIIGKIDIYDINKKTLIERKNKIVTIYDGYVFQLYAQYYSLMEMGYDVERIKIHSIVDNKTYNIDLPDNDINMKQKFEDLINDIKNFEFEKFEQKNIKKCENCIYEPSCDRSKLC